VSNDGGSSRVAKGSYTRQRGLSQINRGRRRLLPPIDGGRNPPCVRQDPPAHNGSDSGGDFFGTSEILERRQIQTAVTPKGNMGRGTKELSSPKPLTAPAAAPEPPRVASTRLRGGAESKMGESGKWETAEKIQAPLPRKVKKTTLAHSQKLKTTTELSAAR